MKGTRTLRLVLVIVTALFLLSAVPPYSSLGSVPALAIDPLIPTTLYAGTFGGGVYKRTDGGALDRINRVR